MGSKLTLIFKDAAATAQYMKDYYNNNYYYYDENLIKSNQNNLVL